MTQYEELKKMIQDQCIKIGELTAKVNELVNKSSAHKYLTKDLNKIAPDAFKALQTAVDKGVIGYGNEGFVPGLTEDMIRLIIYMYRAGVFGE